MSDSKGLGGVKPPELKVAKSILSKVVFKKALSFIMIGILGVIAIYFSFAGTVMRFIPATGDPGLVLVKNLTFDGGIIPPNEIILVTNSELDFSVINKLKMSVTPDENAAIVRVEAGPYGKIEWAEPGIVSVDGNPINSLLPYRPGQTHLQNEYIVTCLIGPCGPGSAIIIGVENIYGSVVTNFFQKEQVSEGNSTQNENERS